MRFFKAATVALLGVSNVFAAPAAIPEAENSLAVRAKDVPSLEAHGYKATAGPALKNKPITYSITKAGVNGMVDQIKIDKTENSLSVLNAENASDNSKDKLKLSDIEMGLWVHVVKKTPGDLAVVRFELVSEKSTLPVIQASRALLKVGDTGPFLVTDKSTGDEKKVFDDLQKTAFGKNVGFLHADFGSGKAKSYGVAGDKNQPTLTVHVK